MSAPLAGPGSACRFDAAPLATPLLIQRRRRPAGEPANLRRAGHRHVSRSDPRS